MKNKYFYLLIALLFWGAVFAQTKETFETDTDGAISFTDNGQVFNISSQAGGTFHIANVSQTGWSSTAKDNKYIDNSGSADWGVPVGFTVSSAGEKTFTLKSFYLFLSSADLNPGAGSCTITGKLKGATVFTATSNTGFNSNILVNNGYTLIDLVCYGGSNNTNTIIDQYVVTTTGTFEYVALDAMTWQYDCSTIVAPTASAQKFCNAGTVANLVATGDNLKWYADNATTMVLTATTALSTKSYYVSQTVGPCESQRTAVNVTITPSTNNVITASACDSYTWSENGITYVESGTYTSVKGCDTQTLNLTINTAPTADAPANVTACESYVLPGLTVGNYFTASNGGGTALSAGNTINSSQTIYVFSQTGTVPNCTDENSFTVTINTAPTADAPANVTACDSYVLPGLTVGNYFTASNGGGTALSAGNTITSSQTIYVFSESGTVPNCTDENSFTVTINRTPIADAPANVTACDSYVLPGLTVGNYFTASNGGGTALSAGNTITSSQTIYVFSETGTVPNCTDENSFTVTINTAPTADAPANVTACGSYVLPSLIVGNYFTASNGGGTALSAGNTITSSQTIYVFSETGTVPNCTNENSFTVSITPTTTNTTTETACDSYTWAVNGTTYSATGNYIFVDGCNTETLDLTITPNTSNTSVVSACDSYTWSANGQTYSTSGDYTYVNGCVIENLALTITTIDASVALVNGVLSSGTPNATYQWVDCNNNNLPIAGAISQAFTPAISGSYGVIVTLGNCSVTSASVNVTTLATDRFDLDTFKFYPNPVNDNLHLSYSKELTSVKVINSQGQVLFLKSVLDKNAQINMSNLPAGIYFVEVKSLDTYKTIKVIKK
jgi:hypothetical protein